jgi:hypothetical protein
MTEGPNSEDSATYEDWDEIEYVYNLIDETLKKDHVQFGGTKRSGNTSATAACYAIIERLSSNLINYFGLEAIAPTIDRLNIFQTSLISNLEKFKYR